MNTTDKTPWMSKLADRRPPYVRWTFYLLCGCLLLLVGIAAGLGTLILRDQGAAGPAAAPGQVAGEMRRDLAGKLLSAGLSGKAIEQYSLYLAESDLPPDRRANVAYTIGKLCMDQGRYEDALAWLYQVEMLDPKTGLASEVGSKIVSCLEHLGRYTQAQYSLDARAGLHPEGDQEFKGGQVVAEIGPDKITLKEVDEALDAMPEWMRQGFSDPAQKEAFLQQYVSEELLYRKAKRLELDKDPGMRKQADRVLRQLLVQKLLEHEVREKVKITPEEVELYFKANQDKYREREAYKIRMIKADGDLMAQVQSDLRRGMDFAEAAGKYSRDQATAGKGGEVESWVQEGMDPTGLGDPARLWKILAGRAKGDICGPTEEGKSSFLFKIDNVRAARDPSLDEVKQRVEQDLSRERVENAFQALVQESLKASDVKLYPEVMRQAGASNAPSKNQQGAPADTAPPAKPDPGANGVTVQPAPQPQAGEGQQ